MLSGKLVNLRPIRRSDLKFISSWINDADVQYYSQEEYPCYFSPWVIKCIYSEGIKGKKYIFIIEDKAGNIIGEIWLDPIYLYNGSAELAIIIGRKEYRGRGYGKDVIDTVKKYCFKELNLNSILLKVFAFNIRAINCYKACGFKIIGRCKKNVTRNGAVYDELIMEVKNNK
jgi:RimJ/RimL family protein N-acetyltransferase